MISTLSSTHLLPKTSIRWWNTWYTIILDIKLITIVQYILITHITSIFTLIIIFIHLRCYSYFIIIIPIITIEIIYTHWLQNSLTIFISFLSLYIHITIHITMVSYCMETCHILTMLSSLLHLFLLWEHILLILLCYFLIRQ